MQVRQVLKDDDRSLTWLSKRIGIGRSALGNYANGHRATPERVRRDVALLLDIREKVAA